MSRAKNSPPSLHGSPFGSRIFFLLQSSSSGQRARSKRRRERDVKRGSNSNDVLTPRASRGISADRGKLVRIFLFFKIFLLVFLFFILKIKLCVMECIYRYYFIVRCRIYMYYFILWGKVVSQPLQRMRIVRQKVEDRADVAVVGSNWWVKNRLTIVYALRLWPCRGLSSLWWVP